MDFPNIQPAFLQLPGDEESPGNVELFKNLSAGAFESMSDTKVAEEILLFIESLDGITSTVTKAANAKAIRRGLMPSTRLVS